jgi:hypothetical protein
MFGCNLPGAIDKAPWWICQNRMKLLSTGFASKVNYCLGRMGIHAIGPDWNKYGTHCSSVSIFLIRLWES